MNKTKQTIEACPSPQPSAIEWFHELEGWSVTFLLPVIALWIGYRRLKLKVQAENNRRRIAAQREEDVREQTVIGLVKDKFK